MISTTITSDGYPISILVSVELSAHKWVVRGIVGFISLYSARLNVDTARQLLSLQVLFRLHSVGFLASTFLSRMPL